MAITSAPAPQISLGLRLGVTVGRNQVQRNVGSYNALIFAPNSNIFETYMELLSSKGYQSNPNEITNALVISTSGPLAFSGIQSDNTVVNLVVARLLVLDSIFKSWSIQNNGTDTVRLNINAITVPAV